MDRTRAAALLALLLCAPSASADGPAPLEHDLRLDLPLTLAATAAWVGSELAKDRLAPEACRLCEPGRLDASVRDAGVWRNPAAARHASDALVFALLPAGVITHQLLSARSEGDLSEGFVDVLVVAEAAALAADLNQLVKFAVGRERPFVHYGDPARPHEADDDLSFYSGHTSLAFALASSAGTVSTLRGYRSAPWVWGVGLGLAATTGYLRIAADRHYLTDVLVGAATGLAIGIAVPRVFHGREGEGDGAPPAARLTAVPLGIAFVF